MPVSIGLLGAYEQWGFGESPYATPTTYTYPLAYSVNALNVVIGSVGGRESTCRINSVSKDSFIAYRHYSGSGTGSGELLTMELLPTAELDRLRTLHIHFVLTKQLQYLRRQ